MSKYFYDGEAGELRDYREGMPLKEKTALRAIDGTVLIFDQEHWLVGRAHDGGRYDPLPESLTRTRKLTEYGSQIPISPGKPKALEGPPDPVTRGEVLVPIMERSTPDGPAVERGVCKVRFLRQDSSLDSTATYWLKVQFWIRVREKAKKEDIQKKLEGKWIPVSENEMDTGFRSSIMNTYREDKPFVIDQVVVPGEVYIPNEHLPKIIAEIDKQVRNAWL